MTEQYTLEIDLNVLHHLGLNLYSNVPSVLSELIANAWDADASVVKVSIKKQGDGKEITIQDNGCGMNDSDLREKFLTVGYEKRKNNSQDKTPEKKRLVMGRKGIGKLSVFSIAKRIQIITKKKGGASLAIELDVDNIRKAIKDKRAYHPEIIFASDISIDIEESGTVLILKDLQKRISTSLDGYLRQRVARRFSVISGDFEVIIDGESVGIQDRNYFGKLEYALVYGDYPKSNFEHDEKYIVSRNSMANEGDEYRVRGWIGLVEKSGSLQEDRDNLNKISVLTRGKVALEDVLELFREGGLYTKYVIGEIEADFLDLTGTEDIATSNRQNFIQNDERFVQLKEFIGKELKHLQRQRVDLKEKTGEAKAIEIPAIKEWYESLQGDNKKAAKKLFGKINAIATDSVDKKVLYQHGIMAFEHLQQKNLLSQLGNLSLEDLEKNVNLFANLDDIEATLYHKITKGRLATINTLSQYVDKHELETVVQKHIYDHLWLLDPSWDRATETASMERSVRTEFGKITKKLSKEEQDYRFDIRYKKSSGKHVIVELKRSSFTTSTGKLMDQVDKYIEALRKVLLLANKDEPIEAICLVGRPLTDWDTPARKLNSEQSLGAKNIRVVTYQELITDAEASYSNYLEKQKEKGRIQSLLDKIDDADL